METKQVKISITDKMQNNNAYYALAGKSEGATQREKLQLTDLEELFDEIIIDIPEKVISINSSFFMGMFKSYIDTIPYGELKNIENAFRKKYIFITHTPNQKKIIDLNIEDGVRDCIIFRQNVEKSNIQKKI